MKRKLKMIVFALLLLPTIAHSQAEDLKKYLQALQTIEFDESKKIVEQYSIENKQDYIIQSFNEPIGQLFDSDIPGIKGYKAIVLCKAKNSKGQIIEDRFLTVMYLNKKASHWVVAGFRTAADPCKEASYSKSDIDKGEFYTDKQYVYRNLGWWQLMCGKISEAEKSFDLANDEGIKKGMLNFVDDYKKGIAAIK